MNAVPAYDLPLIDQSNLLLVWANDSSTLVLAFEARSPPPVACPVRCRLFAVGLTDAHAAVTGTP